MYNPRDTWRQSHRKPRHSEAETKPQSSTWMTNWYGWMMHIMTILYIKSCGNYTSTSTTLSKHLLYFPFHRSPHRSLQFTQDVDKKRSSCHIKTTPPWIYRQKASSIVKALSTISCFVRFVGDHFHLDGFVQEEKSKKFSRQTNLQNLIQAFHPGLHEKMDLAASDNYVYFHMTTWGKLKDASSGSSPPVSFARTVGSNAAALNMGWRTMAQCRACHLMSDSNFWSFHERSNCAFSKRPASATPEETTRHNFWSSLGYIIVTFVPRCPPARQGKCELWSYASKNHGHVQWSRLRTFITSVFLAARGTLQASCWASIAPHCPPPSQWNEAALHCWRFGL